MRNLYTGGCGLNLHNDIMLVAFGSAASLVSAGVRLMINKYLIYGQGFYWFLLTFSEGNEKQPANAPTLRSKLSRRERYELRETAVCRQRSGPKPGW